MKVLKRRDFARWQARERLPEMALCRVVREIEDGLIDATLGGALYKKRIARQGGGKRGGYRTLFAARLGFRYVFLHGFAKGDIGNITPTEQKLLRYVGDSVLRLSEAAIAQAIQEGMLLEVCCDKQNQ